MNFNHFNCNKENLKLWTIIRSFEQYALHHQILGNIYITREWKFSTSIGFRNEAVLFDRNLQRQIAHIAKNAYSPKNNNKHLQR